MPSRPPSGSFHASIAVLLAALTTACASSGDHPGDAGPSDGSIPGTSDDGPASDVPLGDDGPPARKDAGPDRRVGGTPEERYADFRAVRDGLLTGRLVECFNGDPGPQSPATSGAAEADLSLRFGLVNFDDKAADACLEAISAESCQALAAEAHGPTCAKVLQGQLATGALCRVDEDCKQPDKDFCKMQPATICNTRCLPRTANGERCSSGSECLPGSICRPGADGMTTVCVARLGDGEACDSEVCQAGLYCRASSPDGPEGACSPIKAGGDCGGTWQCPPRHACVVSGMAATGVCTAGRKAGEPCQPQAPDQPTVSDCGFGLGCYPDLTSGQLRCTAGRKLDEPCTDRIPCRTGQCVGGKCAPLRTPGQSCSEELSCEDGQLCVEGKCASEILPSGSRCGGSDQRTCAAGTFCKPDGDGGPSGACVPSRKLNEACEPGQCEPTLDCVGGICRRCG